MNTKINLRFSILTGLVLLAAFSRIIPHPANFSPLAAIALFGAAHFSKKWHILLIPIAATWLSDLFINNVIYAAYYPTFTLFYEGFYWQYLSYLIIAIISIPLFKKVNKERVLIGALSSTIIFFLISNVGCWIGNSIYPQNFIGLMSCYAAGIPFLKGTILGDLFYSLVLFGGFAFAQYKFPVLIKVENK
jgi:hypothetical protein